MAYTPPGGNYLKRYIFLVKANGKEMMNIEGATWDNIFPQPFKGNISVIDPKMLSDKDLNTFKISDVLPQHRLKKKQYLEFIAMQTGVYNTIILEKYIEKICKWCGDDDIIMVPNFFEHRGCILTASLDPNDKLGVINHYIKMTKNWWIKKTLWFRSWRARRILAKMSANRHNFILDGNATTTTNSMGVTEQQDTHQEVSP